jgi:hypothetical protein
MFGRRQTHIQRLGLRFILWRTIANRMAPFTLQLNGDSGTVRKKYFKQ